ncbi:unnamed protein product [Prorocentrum cordatum]|uniref:Uncharacterized protein n=1 Tax=Prorocentrum cordatum TaxID=2364126 RepID=A0ABN9WIT2_9DINO|nr:unnamed protein product [Polarella glacialis]
MAYCEIHATFMVPSASTSSAADLDQPGRRISVKGGGAYDLWLSRNMKHAELVRATTLDESYEIFHRDNLDALAGLKPKLLSDLQKAPGLYKLLDGHFMAVQQAVGCIKAEGGGAGRSHFGPAPAGAGSRACPAMAAAAADLPAGRRFSGRVPAAAAAGPEATGLWAQCCGRAPAEAGGGPGMGSEGAEGSGERAVTQLEDLNHAYEVVRHLTSFRADDVLDNLERPIMVSLIFMAMLFMVMPMLEVPIFRTQVVMAFVSMKMPSSMVLRFLPLPEKAMWEKLIFTELRISRVVPMGMRIFGVLLRGEVSICMGLLVFREVPMEMRILRALPTMVGVELHGAVDHREVPMGTRIFMALPRMMVSIRMGLLIFREVPSGMRSIWALLRMAVSICVRLLLVRGVPMEMRIFGAMMSISSLPLLLVALLAGGLAVGPGGRPDISAILKEADEFVPNVLLEAVPPRTRGESRGSGFVQRGVGQGAAELRGKFKGS